MRPEVTHKCAPVLGLTWPTLDSYLHLLAKTLSVLQQVVNCDNLFSILMIYFGMVRGVGVPVLAVNSTIRHGFVQLS